MVYVIQVRWQLASRIRTDVQILLASCQRTCMTYTIAVCTVKNSWWWTEELSETCRGRTSRSCSQAVSKPVWHIPLLCLQWKTPDDGQRNCPKHVVFYSKNKFDKLVHLFGLIIRIYHDARSPEPQIHTFYGRCVLSVSLTGYEIITRNAMCAFPNL